MFSQANAAAASKLTKKEVAATLFWLQEVVLHRKEWVDPSEHLAFRPLSCRVPLPGLPRDMSVSLSGYECHVRRAVEALCLGLRISFSHRMERRKMTHLVTNSTCPTAKFTKATEWGKRVVTAAWLYACVEQGRAVPEGGFYPPPPEVDPGAHPSNPRTRLHARPRAPAHENLRAIAYASRKRRSASARMLLSMHAPIARFSG